MFLLGGEVRQAVLEILGESRDACVALESAARLHLGRPTTLPVLLGSPRAPRPTHAGVQVACGGSRSTVLVSDGLRVSDLEGTLLALCQHPISHEAIPLAAALVQSGSTLETRRVDLARLVRMARRSGSGAAQRRLSWILLRAGNAAASARLLPSDRQGPVKLDPLGAAVGPEVPKLRLVLNVADGLPATEDLVEPLVGWLLSEFHDAAVRLALRGVAHLPVPADEESLAETLRVRGDLRPGPGGLDATPGLEAVCTALVARVDERTIRRALEVLHDARPRTAAARCDALVLLARFGDPRATGALSTSFTPDDAASLDLRRATALLEAAIPTLPPASTDLLLERTGRWTTLRERALAALSVARGTQRPARALQAAQACWRAGRNEEAGTLLDSVPARAWRGALAVRMALLRGTLELERGARSRAATSFARARVGARRIGDATLEARALHRMGTLFARAGRIEEAATAYRGALERLGDDPAHDGLRGILQSNLAWTEMCTGHFEDAERMAREALATKRRAGTPAEIAVTEVMRARIARARGDAEPPGGRFSALMPGVEEAGDPRLAVETCADLAESWVRSGSLAAAQQALDRARQALGRLRPAEPVLAAMIEHTESLLLAARGDLAGAMRRLDRSVRTFDRFRGVWWAARARRDGAAMALASGDRAQTLARYAGFVRQAGQAGLRLGEVRTHVALHAWVARWGRGAVRAEAERELAGVGESEVRQWLLAAGRSDLADARRDVVTGRTARSVAVARSPHGTRALDADGLAKLLAGDTRTVVVDERAGRLVRPDGVAIPLARKRVLAPLLRLLVAREGQPVLLDDLVSGLWGRRDTRAADAAKMSISRLRSTLGPWGDAIVAVRLASGLAYTLDRSLPVVFVGAVT